MADVTITYLPERTVAGRSDGAAVSGNFPEDPWMRLREIHFEDEDDEDHIFAVVTFKMGDVTTSDFIDLAPGAANPNWGTSPDGIFTVGVHTQKRFDTDYEVLTTSVQVVGWKQKKPDPDKPDEVIEGIQFQKNSDGSMTVLFGVQVWSTGASLPNNGPEEAETLIRFDRFGPK